VSNPELSSWLVTHMSQILFLVGPAFFAVTVALILFESTTFMFDAVGAGY